MAYLPQSDMFLIPRKTWNRKMWDMMEIACSKVHGFEFKDTPVAHNLKSFFERGRFGFVDGDGAERPLLDFTDSDMSLTTDGHDELDTHPLLSKREVESIEKWRREVEKLQDTRDTLPRKLSMKIGRKLQHSEETDRERWVLSMRPTIFPEDSMSNSGAPLSTFAQHKEEDRRLCPKQRGEPYFYALPEPSPGSELYTDSESSYRSPFTYFRIGNRMVSYKVPTERFYLKCPFFFKLPLDPTPMPGMEDHIPDLDPPELFTETILLGLPQVFGLLLQWVQNDRLPPVEESQCQGPERIPILQRISLYRAAQQIRNVELMDHIVSDLILSYERLDTKPNIREIVHAFWVTGAGSLLTRFMATYAARIERKQISKWTYIKRFTDVRGQENEFVQLIRALQPSELPTRDRPIPLNHCRYHALCQLAEPEAVAANRTIFCKTHRIASGYRSKWTI